jgi:hypothetical protein
MGVSPPSFVADVERLAPGLVAGWRVDLAADLARRGCGVSALCKALCLPQRSVRALLVRQGRRDVVDRLWPRNWARKAGGAVAPDGPPDGSPAMAAVMAGAPDAAPAPRPLPRTARLPNIPDWVLARAWAHVASLPPAPVWDAGGDMALAQAKVRGAPLATVAAALRLSPEDMEARWQVLCPNRNLPMAAAAVLRALELGERRRAVA